MQYDTGQRLPPAVPYPVSEEHEEQPDMPTEFHPLLGQVLKDHKALFKMQLGKTSIAEHNQNGGCSPNQGTTTPYPLPLPG